MDARDRSYPRFTPGNGPFEVCPTCSGRGQVVNPNIDRNGLTTDDMYEQGVEFAESYARGVFDIPCPQCRGLRVVPDNEEYRDECDGMYEVDRDREAEMRHMYGPNY